MFPKGRVRKGKIEVEKFQQAIAYLDRFARDMDWSITFAILAGTIVIILAAYGIVLLTRINRHLDEVNLGLSEVIGELGGVRMGINGIKNELGDERLLALLRELQALRADLASARRGSTPR
jgi:hypothetical protein